MRKLHQLVAAGSLLFAVAATPAPAFAWGGEGHRTVALIAEHFLAPAVRQKVDGLLAADPDNTTAHDIASEATWADKIKSNPELNRHTSMWHYMDIELSNPNVDEACFNNPPLPLGAVASDGPARDCILNKIDEFTAELVNHATDPEERIVALKFLLHFVGDLHQPLHDADDHDRGGNAKRVSAPGIETGNLHHYWDTEFVVALGSDPRQLADKLIAGVSEAQAKKWATGTPLDWARESFALARDDAYGRLPWPTRGRYRLTDAYVQMATKDVAAQLSKAGVRLAFVLDTALAERN